MNPNSEFRSKILGTLQHKASIKQHVYDNTVAVFGLLKESLHELLTELDETLEEKIDKNIRIEYRDKGKFEAHAYIAEDVLVFALDSDIYQFHREHKVWQNPYVAEERDNSYCGIINIYNFLADSFHYKRSEDEGYLIGRIFVNRNMHYFVEGKRQMSQRVEKFGSAIIDRKIITDIIETAIDYALNFDLLVPPYDFIKKAQAEQFNTRFESVKLKTGKRLGYDFFTDDI